MIVDTMNYNEVGKELLKYYSGNIGRITGLLLHKGKEYRRIVLAKGERRVDFKPLCYENDGNEVFIFPFSNGKKDFKKYGMSFYLVVRFFYRGQFWYAKFDGRYMDTVEIYNYHFFQRYIERHLKSDDKVGIDIVFRFIKETNAVTMSKKIDSDKYDNCAYGSTSIGMCLGQEFDNIRVWKTFIDKSTIEYGIKKKTFDVGSELVKPIGVDALGRNIYHGEYMTYNSVKKMCVV